MTALYIDVKYVSYIAGRLSQFKKKDATLWNFRCPICLDSKTNKYKARGYLFAKEQKLFYSCHNCGASMHFGAFLESVDPVVYGEYRRECYQEKNQGVRKKVEKVERVEDDELIKNLAKTDTAARFAKKVVAPPPSLLDGLMDRLDRLPGEHEAVRYALDRKIPKDQLHKMYFIPNMLDIVQLSARYEGRIKSQEPRIVMPFYDTKGQLTGVTCRAIRGESLRYVVVKVKDDVPLIFGINDIDRSKKVYVVEGPIDSMFIPNAVAVGGTGMGKINFLGLSDTTIVFDNQPRNKDVCRIQERAIANGNNVVVWNPRLTQKDINDMAKDGVDYMKEIDSRTYSGLQAKLEFDRWKKC
jgi:transcription elongation factor Elf1